LRALVPSSIAPGGEPRPAPSPHSREATLRREVGTLRNLVAAAARGELLAAGPQRGLVVVDQSLVEGLVRAQLPATHLVAGRFHVMVSTVAVTFDDGLALLRVEGRVRLQDAPEDVYADLVVLGDLHVVPRAGETETLRLHATITSVEARHVEIGVQSENVDRLVEEVSRVHVEAFAALAPDLEMPVRWAYRLDIPGIGPGGPVVIDDASVSVSLRLVEVRAMAGRLWLAADLGIGEKEPIESVPPVYTAPLLAEEDPTALRAEHGRLHQSLDDHLKADPTLAACLAPGRDLTFVLPRGALTVLAQEIAVKYLDRVGLSLDDIRVSRSGEMHSNTAVGKIHSGSWALQAELDHVRGVLRAGRPQVGLGPSARFRVSIPVHIEAGSGEAAIDFRWDSHGIANLVCRDFVVRERVAGAVVREEHALEGVVTIASAGDDLTLTPRFERRHRLHVAPSADAWASAHRALEAQDSLFRCGLALKPDTVLRRIRDVVGRGFTVQLPEKLFRPVHLPSILAHKLRVADRDVQVSALESSVESNADFALLSLRLRVTVQEPAGTASVTGASVGQPHR
jgi:hypothetical protein